MASVNSMRWDSCECEEFIVETGAVEKLERGYLSVKQKGSLNPVARRLIWTRALRSVGQGAMVVDLALYLKDLRWSAVSIGSVTTAAGLVGAVLILAVGVMSDRFGRKRFLLSYEVLTTGAALAASLTTHAYVLVIAIVVAGFGRGQSGAAGPFSPAEQAWLARYVERDRRGMVFSLNNAVGFFGMAFGALVGGWPTVAATNSPLLAYRPVFWMVAVLSVASAVIIAGTHEGAAEPVAPMVPLTLASAGGKTDEVNAHEDQIRHQENTAILKLALVNTLNGLAVGLTGPLMGYWFSVRYGVGTAAVGATISLSFLMTGLTSVLNGFMARRFGMVKSVTWMRVAGSLMMLALPFMPNFGVASALYIVRSAANRGTQGNRSALSASLTRDTRRGFATSINALSMRLPSSVGPTVTGYLMNMGLMATPLVLTAGLQLINAGLYQWVFGKYDRINPVSREKPSESTSSR